jgi:hypothetical protein
MTSFRIKSGARLMMPRSDDDRMQRASYQSSVAHVMSPRDEKLMGRERSSLSLSLFPPLSLSLSFSQYWFCTRRCPISIRSIREYIWYFRLRGSCSGLLPTISKCTRATSAPIRCFPFECFSFPFYSYPRFRFPDTLGMDNLKSTHDYASFSIKSYGQFVC